MKKRTLPILVLVLFSLIICGAIGNAQTGKLSPSLQRILAEGKDTEHVKVWIFFRDKGQDIQSRIHRIAATLSRSTIKRRLRNDPDGPIADSLDIPVNSDYFNIVRPDIIKPRHASRWLNAVSAEVSVASLPVLAGHSCVTRILPVRSIRIQPIPQPALNTETETSTKEASHLIDYGISYTQLNQIGVPDLHDQGYSGNGVIICMLDAGFNNLAHESLQHLHILSTWDFVNHQAYVGDCAGCAGEGSHGTSTLSVIGGYYPGKLVGPAYGASYLLGKTENSESERHVEEDNWIAGAEWAESLGADIISSSLGYRYDFTNGDLDYDADDMDGETAIITRGANIAAAKGILVVNSAGNEAARGRFTTIGAPADSARVLATGAVNASGTIADFSSRGPTADGRIKPDVCAMGVSVYNAASTGNNYRFSNGTSFSCPLTAGTAALILEAHSEWTNRQIMMAMKDTASQSQRPDHIMGWGIIHAPSTLSYIQPVLPPPEKFAVTRGFNNLIFYWEGIDRLTWNVDSDYAGQVTGYRIEELNLSLNETTFKKIADLAAGSLSYEVRGRNPSAEILYRITAITLSGAESAFDYCRAIDLGERE